ncbi:radical SAM protein [Candidatus Micrarchaeota archaeon]|nr:radical SAM protein [Candidatus Micrarchaeota archaeon]
MLKFVDAKSILTETKLPGLDYSLNPFRGCTIGCPYCYSPDVLRETREWGKFLDVKENAPQLLEKELRTKKRGLIGIGTVTDGYVQAERELKMTRRCLEKILEAGWPVSIQTKSSLVVRDLDLLKRFKEKGLEVEVGFTITTLDPRVSAVLEPFASPPLERIAAMKEIHDAGIRVWCFVGPIYPGFDSQCEELVRRIAGAGCDRVLSHRFALHRTAWARVKKALEEKMPEQVTEWEHTLFTEEGKKFFDTAYKQLADACGRYHIKHEFAFGKP